MDRIIFPAPLTGTVRAVGSKSDVHRALICAALADAPTRIRGVTRSKDIDATAGCLAALGARVSFDGADCFVTPLARRADAPLLDCGESGSTLRFLLPVAAAVCGAASFTGRGRLPERPIGPLVEAMRSGGVTFDRDALPLTVTGRLRAGNYALPGNVSSQYVSGLLLALSVTEGESTLTLTSPLESAPYVSMTLDTLGRFGADVRKTEHGWAVTGKEKLTSPETLDADGDWSNAAFFLASAAIGGSIRVTGLRRRSVQGDRAVADILRRFGADVHWEGDTLAVNAAPLRGCTVELTDVPDLLPILAVTAAYADGTTRFTGGARLRLKESDRLASVAALLRGLGGEVSELPDGLTVRGGGLSGGTVDGANDHRIVMAAAVAGAHAGAPVTIREAEAVSKSYPQFFDDFSALGGKSDVI